MPSATTDSFHSVSEQYIDTIDGFARFADSLVASGELSACSIDTEADSMHSYETKLCLIQFSVPGHLAIIDPLAIGIENLGSFPGFIDQFGEVWMHGADYDISMFRMTFGWVPRRILDTQIAAKLLGVTKFGLANLLEGEYGVTVSKQSQKADWSRRPLSPKMLAYAYNDVRYLLDLGDRFVSRLREAGREEWFHESCDAAIDNVLQRDERPDQDPWRISGCGKLSPRGLNYLKHLWQWRDDECRRLDRPAFKFVGNKEILRMVKELEGGKGLTAPHFLKPHYLKRLKAAVAKAEAVPGNEYPSKKVRGTGPRLEINEAEFERIRSFRNKEADRLGIDGTVIATRIAMEKLASTNLERSEQLDGLMKWQQEVLAPVIEKS